jgi:UDP-4-amino-4,6-dideoxy-N-acetyl-beta-L-altrosamine transaminase
MFIPYGKQWIDEEDIKEVVRVLKSDFITQGPKIKEFEEKLAESVGAKYAVVFNSGTSALHASYFSVGLSSGDEFITTPITFVATSNAGLFLGAKPVFCDVEEDTGNLNPEILEEKITSRTKLVVPVHYAGHPCDMEKIKKIADKHGLFVIEDACHALGAKYKETKIGSCEYSDLTVFSFHPVKHITTGEGGAVLTNRKDLYEKLLMFRNHGITKNSKHFVKKKEGDWYYEMQFLGFNYRMTDIQAVLGISQLKKLNKFVKKRREIAQTYNKLFNDNPYFNIPVEKNYAFHSYHLYPIRLKEPYESRKPEIFRKLRDKGLGVQVHYIPVYLHPYYQKLGYKKGECPVAEKFYRQEISLPLYPAMEDKDIYYVVSAVFEVMEEIGGN